MRATSARPDIEFRASGLPEASVLRKRQIRQLCNGVGRRSLGPVKHLRYVSWSSPAARDRLPPSFQERLYLSSRCEGWCGRIPAPPPEPMPNALTCAQPRKVKARFPFLITISMKGSGLLEGEICSKKAAGERAPPGVLLSCLVQLPDEGLRFVVYPNHELLVSLPCFHVMDPDIGPSGSKLADLSGGEHDQGADSSACERCDEARHRRQDRAARGRVERVSAQGASGRACRLRRAPGARALDATPVRRRQSTVRQVDSMGCKIAMLAVVATTAAGCGSSSGSSSTSAQNANSSGTSAQQAGSSGNSTQDATLFWRQQVASQYQGPVATDDGRGCARASKNRYVCTAYVKNPSRDIDVFGTVTVHDGTMTVHARLNKGDEITKWFQQTGGGCQTSTCQGTRLG